MYLMTKSGFFEIDRWDGTPIKGGPPLYPEQAADDVYIVRAREEAHIRSFVRDCLPKLVEVYHTPHWDYPWRVYLTAEEMRYAMERVVDHLDYRNFKSWCADNRHDMHSLAYDVWEASERDAASKEDGG